MENNIYLTTPKIQKRKNLILLSISYSAFLAMLIASILSLAISDFSHAFNISEALGEKTVSMYLLVLAIFTLLFGKIADKHGKKKIFNLGIFILIIGSIVGGLAFNFEILIIARIIQAIGSAMVLSNNNALVSEIFDTNQRGKALGILGAFSIIGGIAGPSVGGFIIDFADWHYLFWLVIPLLVLAYIFNAKAIPKDEYFIKEKVDYKGFIIILIALLSLFFAILLGQFISFTSIYFFILLIIFLILLFVYIKYEKKITNQLFNFSLFKNLEFTIGLITAFIIYGTTYFYTVPMPLYLQDTLSLSSLQSGLLFLIFPVVMSVLSPFTGILADKYSKKVLIIIGMTILIISQALFLLLEINSSIYIFVFNSILMGIGMSLFQTPNNTMVMSVADNYNLASVGSLKAFAQNFGRFFGIIFASTFLYLAMSIDDKHHVSSYLENKPEIFIFGLHTTFIISFVLCIIALLLAIFLFVKTKNKLS